MFRHILCPIDFSKASDRALEHAVAWAQRDACALELLHVLEPILDVGPEIMLLTADLEQQSHQHLEARVRERVHALHERVPDVRGHVLRGPAAPTILARAKAADADLVVMSATGPASSRACCSGAWSIASSVRAGSRSSSCRTTRAPSR